MRRYKEAEKQFQLALEIDPNYARTHSNYGYLLFEIGRTEEAEKQYQLALEIDPNDANIHSDYGSLLLETGHKEEAEKQYQLALEINPSCSTSRYDYGRYLHNMGRNEEAEIHYQLALEIDPNNENIHSDYGIFLYETGRKEEAEKQFQFALQVNPKRADILHNYGLYLFNMRRNEEAEKQYQLSLSADPNSATTHYNYGNLLIKIGSKNEAEEHYKLAIEFAPFRPEIHAAYSLLLVSLGLENEENAIEEMNTSYRLFKEKGNMLKGHLILALVYEELANEYYNIKKYQESGQYAKLSGNEYIEASENPKTKLMGSYLAKGYALKGRAEIRKLNLNNLDQSFNEKTIARIMRGMYDASKHYQMAAETSQEDNQICRTCSLSMKCLCEMLDHMFALIDPKSTKTVAFEDKIKKWKTELNDCEKIYDSSIKGKVFAQSLYKLIHCIENLANYKMSTMLLDKVILEDCIKELVEVANKIEGPLQNLIENAAKQMDKCKDSITIHGSFMTGPLTPTDKIGAFGDLEKGIKDLTKNLSESRTELIVSVGVDYYGNGIKINKTIPLNSFSKMKKKKLKE